MIKIEYEMLGLRMDSNIDDKASFVKSIRCKDEERRRINMKKMRRGVALLLSALLVWTPAGTVRADEATGAADVNGQIEIQENKVSEDEAQANEAQAEVLKSLYLGSEDKNGTNWMYTASDHTLKITGDMQYMRMAILHWVEKESSI